MPSEKSTRRYRVHSQYDPRGLLRRGKKLNASYASLGLPNTPSTLQVQHGVPDDSSSNRPPGRVRSRAKWASECLKLLEAMLELDDSEPFRQPLDPRKYSEFYNKIVDAIDLSKVMIKFHSGQYPTPDDFVGDINKMFADYKKIFVDPQSQIYSQVHRLSWWFESEASRILSDWKGKVKKVVSRINSDEPRQYWRDVAAHSTVESSVPRGYRPTQNNSSLADATSVPSQVMGLEPMPSKDEDSTNIILSIKHGMCTIVQQQQKGDGREVSNAASMATSPQQAQGTCLNNNSILRRQSAPRVQTPAASTSNSSTSKLKARSRSHSSSSQFKEAPRPSGSQQKKPSAPAVEVTLDVSTIWCGSLKFKPQKPVTINEKGISLFLIKDTQVIEFNIRASDIIRCLGHFERTRRHTLFLCLLPSSCRRFSLTFGEKSITSSLMALFMPASATNSIAHILHVFWNMGKMSIFGQLFSEIDSQAALDLLAQIRPAILNKIGEELSLRAGQQGHGNTRSQHTSKEANRPASKSTVAVITDTSVARRNSTTEPAASAAPSAAPSESVSEPAMALDLSGGIPVDTSVSMPDLSPTDQPQPNSPTNVSISSSSAGQAATMPSPKSPCYIPSFTTDQEAMPIPTTLAFEQDHVVDLSGDDSDLEIVVPSDEELYNTRPGVKAEYGDTSVDTGDLVVMGEKVSLKCPITQQMMQRPVKNKHCGHCYDRQGVEEIIKFRGEKARCPMPGCSNPEPLCNKDLLYDYELWKKIQAEMDPNWIP